MKILLLGAKGQLGIELQKVLPELGEVIALSRNELDLSNQIALSQKLSLIKPDLIVNASAYTSVDKAEIEKDLAMLINASVPEILAKHSKINDIILVHYSTDYVFDGRKSTPYIETDETRPLSVYGSTKVNGEQFITNSKCQHLIFRTSWLFSPHGHNFLTTILNLAKEKKELNIVSDQWGTPTSCHWLAKITLAALKICLSNKSQNKKVPWGTYHACPNGFTNWYEYAKFAILTKYKNINNFQQIEVHPINTKEYKQKVIRPQSSVLSNKKLVDTFNIDASNWKELVTEVINQLK